MPFDFRVPMTPIANAFGVAITVTRPYPDETPIQTIGIWVSPGLDEDRPFGRDIQRLDARRVMAIERTTALSSAARGTTIVAPETAGGPLVTWRVDGYQDAVKSDEMRVILVETVA